MASTEGAVESGHAMIWGVPGVETPGSVLSSLRDTILRDAALTPLGIGLASEAALQVLTNRARARSGDERAQAAPLRDAPPDNRREKQRRGQHQKNGLTPTCTAREDPENKGRALWSPRVDARDNLYHRR